MKRNVAFAGPLADHFTHDTFALEVDNLVSLFSALEANFEGFKNKLKQFRDVAIYKITGKDRAEPVTEQEFAISFGSADTILIAAAEDGSAMVGFAAITEWLASYGVTSVIVAAAVYVAVNIAIAYATQAAMKALSKSPSTSSSTTAQNASYLFNGPQNPTEQGGAIPIIYGRFTVGGTIISSDISSDQLPYAADDSFTVQSGQSYSANVTTNDVLRQYLTVTNWTLNGTSYGASATINHPETTTSTQTYDSDIYGYINLPGSQDGYTITLGSDGTVSITSQAAVNATYSGTYTAHDSSTNTDVTAKVTISIQAAQGYNFSGGEGTGPGAPGDAPGEGGGIGGTGASAGDGTSGDGGTGGGDGSGSGGGSGSA